MKLLNLTLDNFKGTKHFSLDLPNGCSATVYGENGTGKTTLVDAWCWLLYGIDSAGSSDSKNGGFQVLPTETSGLQASVRAVIEKDGETHTLQRVYQEDFTRKTGEPEAGPSKSHTRFYVDDVPLKTKKQYDDYISTLFPSRELGLALTIPSYFPKVLPPDIRRDMLLKIFSPEITEDAVMERHPELARLRSCKGYKTVEQYRDWAKSRRMAVNRELDSIPGRIDEAEKAKREDISTPEDEREGKRLMTEKAKLAVKISAVQSGADRMDAVRRRSEAQAKLAERKAAYVAKFTRANDGLAADAEGLRKQIYEKEKTLIELRQQQENSAIEQKNLREMLTALSKEWEEIRSGALDKIDTLCPTCGQPLPPDRIQEAKKKLLLSNSTKLSRIEEEGARVRARLRETSLSGKEKLQIFSSTQQEVDGLKKKLDRLSQAIITPPPFEETQEYLDLSGQISALQQEEAVLRTCAEKKIAPLLEKAKEIDGQLEEISRRKLIRDINRQQEQRIRDLLDSQRSLGDELTELEDGIRLADDFIRLRAMDLEESINGHFDMVRFKLFDRQVNGGIKSCCEAMASNGNGGPFVEYGSNLNEGRRIQAGVDIINAITKATGVTAPIWIDGAGELTKKLDTDLQHIRLYASKGDTALRVETKTETREEAE